MKHLLMILLLPVCLVGQAHRMFEYAIDGTDQVQRLQSLIQIPGVKVIADPVLGLVSIYGDTEEKVSAAEAQFKKFFKPKAPSLANRNVELTLHVLYGETGSAKPNEVQAVLQPVVQQLKTATTLTSFRTIETQLLRIRSGKKVEASGVLPWNPAPENLTPTYQFRAEVASLEGQVRLDNLAFTSRVPYAVADGQGTQFVTRELGIFTAVDIKPGQYVLVGKTNVSAKEGALILVLSAKLVD